MKRIHIDNLPYEATEEKVRGLLAQYGIVHSIAVEWREDPSRPRAYAFAEMDDADAEIAVREMQDLTIDDHRVGVSLDAAGDVHRSDLVD